MLLLLLWLLVDIIGDGMNIPCYGEIQYFIITYQNKLSDVFRLAHELGI
jgi:hypothetical protein